MPAGAADLGVREEAAFRAAVAAAAPSIVSIETIGGLETVGEVLVGTGPSSGVIATDDGYIVTSSFNFAHKPASIIVVLPDGVRLPARLVGRDESRKLVLLKVDAPQSLPVAAVAPESDAVVGTWTVAVGRTFEAEQPNVSVGIVSAVRRIWGKALQTDAKISSANYGGALVDLRGRIQGVLVPLSPNANEDVSGTEWYDSGIGFAVPMEHVQKILPRLKAGETLKRGLVGLQFKGPNVYADPPLVAKCRAGSPAYEAGIRDGDLVTAVEGRPVEVQAQVMEQLQSRYAGDVVRFTLARGSEKLDREIKLVDKLDPYRRPFLGLLAERTVEPSDGVTIRHVFADSPAAKAGLKPGDVVTAIADVAVRSRDELRNRTADVQFGKPVKLAYLRDGAKQDIELTPVADPEAIPTELSPAADAKAAASADLKNLPAAKPLKIAALPNEAKLYVPATYDDGVQHALVVLLHPKGGFADKAIVERWRTRAAANGWLLLVPQAAEGAWQSRDLEFVQKAIDRAAEDYRIDPTRVVAVGYEEGGDVALRTAAMLRRQIRAAATINSASIVFSTESDPLLPTSLYLAFERTFPAKGRVTSAVERIREAKVPVVVRELPARADDWTDETFAEWTRWLDSLDRI